MSTIFDLAGQIFDIQSALISAIAVDYVAFDLSNVGDVLPGRWPDAPKYPFVAVDLESLSSEDDAAPLGAYEKTAVFFIEGWLTITQDTPTSASVFSKALVGGITASIQNAHQTAGGLLKAEGTRRVNVTETEFLNSEISGKKVAHFRANVEIVYKVISGTVSGI